jgi:hypothetical protein
VTDPQGTVTWWDLADAAAGQPIFGWGPYQNHGAGVGGLSFGGSSGVAFDGGSGYVNIPNSASLAGIGSPSGPSDNWAIWCRVTRGPVGAVRALVSKGDRAWRLQLDATGRPQLVSNGNVIATAANPLNTSPHTILAGRSSTAVFILVDGLPEAFPSGVTDFTVPNALPLRLGADSDAAGNPRDFYNGTLHAAALLPTFFAGGGLGPVILVKIPAGYTVDVPALLTAWRDPADVSNVTALVYVLAGHGRVPLVSAEYAIANNIAGGSTGTITLDSHGRGSFSFPLAAAMNGKAITVTYIRARGSSTNTTWDNPLRAQWAIARLTPNVALGDHVSELTTVPSHSVPATHTAATFLRAATGPNAGDFAAGSSWSLLPSTAQAGLPATNAFLATQLQLVRRA